MEIEKIVTTVQEKLGQTDVSAQTIQKAVEFRNSVAPLAEGVEPDDAYFEGIVNLAKDFQGNINHLLAGKTKEWQKKFAITKENIKNLSEEERSALLKELNGEPSPDGNEKVTNLERKLQEFEKKFDLREKEIAQAELKRKVRQEMLNANVSDEYILDVTLERAGVLDAEKPIEEITKDLLKKYDAEYLKAHGDGSQPRKGIRTSEGSGSWLDKKFAEKAKKEGWSK